MCSVACQNPSHWFLSVILKCPTLSLLVALVHAVPSAWHVLLHNFYQTSLTTPLPTICTVEGFLIFFLTSNSCLKIFSGHQGLHRHPLPSVAMRSVPLYFSALLEGLTPSSPSGNLFNNKSLNASFLLCQACNLLPAHLPNRLHTFLFLPWVTFWRTITYSTRHFVTKTESFI